MNSKAKKGFLSIASRYFNLASMPIAQINTIDRSVWTAAIQLVAPHRLARLFSLVALALVVHYL
jgi:hypothetical protein